MESCAATYFHGSKQVYVRGMGFTTCSLATGEGVPASSHSRQQFWKERAGPPPSEDEEEREQLAGSAGPLSTLPESTKLLSRC